MFKFINGLLRPNTTDLDPSTFNVSRRGFLVGSGALLATPLLVKLDTIQQVMQANTPDHAWMLSFSIFNNRYTATVVPLSEVITGSFTAPEKIADMLESEYARWARPGVDIELTPEQLGLPDRSLVPYRKSWTGVRIPEIGKASLLQKSINRG